MWVEADDVGSMETEETREREMETTIEKGGWRWVFVVDREAVPVVKEGARRVGQSVILVIWVDKLRTRPAPPRRVSG
jgi:hypothetical protein